MCQQIQHYFARFRNQLIIAMCCYNGYYCGSIICFIIVGSVADLELLSTAIWSRCVHIVS